MLENWFSARLFKHVAVFEGTQVDHTSCQRSTVRLLQYKCGVTRWSNPILLHSKGLVVPLYLCMTRGRKIYNMYE
jgi:hypothetical protein